MGRLLIIDDDQDVARILARAGALSGFETRSTDQPDVFLELVSSWKPTVAIIDLAMPEMDGVQVLRRLADQRCDAHILIVSGMDARTMQTVSRLGTAQALRMAGTLSKPFRLPELRAVLEPLLRA